ncbi:MAG: hypothetical protein ACKVOU_09525 [Cytophagales bacterium]
MLLQSDLLQTSLQIVLLIISFIFCLVAMVAIPTSLFLLPSVWIAYIRAKRYAAALPVSVLSDDLLGKIIKFKGAASSYTSSTLLAPLSLQPVAKWRLDFFLAGDSNTDGTDHNICFSDHPVLLNSANEVKVLVYDTHFVMINMPVFAGEATAAGRANLVLCLKEQGYVIGENQTNGVQERSIPLGTMIAALGKLIKKEGQYIITSPDEDEQAPVSALYEYQLDYREFLRLFFIAFGCIVGAALMTWFTIWVWTSGY